LGADVEYFTVHKVIGHPHDCSCVTSGWAMGEY